MKRFAGRPRLTIRKLMVLVAIFGLSFGGFLWGARMWDRHAAKMWDRSKEANLEASRHEKLSRWWSNRIRESTGIAAPVTVTRIPIRGIKKSNLEIVGYDTTQPYFYDWRLGYEPQNAHKYPIDPHFEELMVVLRERVAYHERMRRKWAWASWKPWEPFEPDPPKPPVGEPDSFSGGY